MLAVNQDKVVDAWAVPVCRELDFARQFRAIPRYDLNRDVLKARTTCGMRKTGAAKWSPSSVSPRYAVSPSVDVNHSSSQVAVSSFGRMRLQ